MTCRRRAIALMVLAVAAGLAGCGRSNTEPSRAALSMGTSSVGSAFYTLAVGMADIVGREAKISLTAEPIGGSDANLRALRAGRVDLALLNADSAVAGFTGTGQFAKEGKIPIRLIAQGQLSLRQVVARAAAGIRTPADLANKRFIMRRKALGELEVLGNRLLAAYGVPVSSVTIVETAETSDAVEALKIGSADAAIIPGGVPSSQLSDLSQATDVVFVSLPPDKLEAILADMGPAFRPGVIPAGTYRGQNADVTVPAMTAVLVARADLPEEMVYGITKALFTNGDRISKIHAAGRDWTVQNSLAHPPLGFHAGAVRYYEEIGAWRSELAEVR